MKQKYQYSYSEIKATDMSVCLVKINKRITKKERVVSVMQMGFHPKYRWGVIWETEYRKVS